MNDSNDDDQTTDSQVLVSNVDCVHVIPSDDEADEIVAPTATNDPKKGDHATEVQVFVARVLVVHVMPSGDEAA